MKKLSKFFIPAILITLGAIVFIRGLVFLDPDFGWHLRAGQVIVQSGIQATDPFSYTMPSYQFIDHEWLINVAMFLVYRNFGIYFLSAIFALIFVLALYFSIPKKLKNYSALPILLAGLVMLGFSGVRTQEITWFFLALLLNILFDKDKWEKWKYFTPLLFLPWVNLHGGFALGIAVLGLALILETIKGKRIAFDNLKVLIASLFVTFINPYGLRIWYEIWMQVSDGSLRWYVSEWMPGIFLFDIAFCILLVLSFSSIWIYRKKLNFTKTGIYFLLLLMAFSSVRHVPLWTISAVFVTSEGFLFFWDDIKKNKDNVLRFEKAKIIFTIIFFLLFMYEAGGVLFGSYNLNVYPQGAVSFLAKKNITGNILSVYNVGGYLIWKLPTHKVFIDGRMPSWRRTGYYPNESDYAFKDYLKMVSDDKFFKKELKKYNIEYVLFSKIEKKKKESVFDKAEKILDKIVFKNIDYHILSEDLTKFKMQKIYDDKKFVIYKNILF